MAITITETKLPKKPNQGIKKSIPKYWCSFTFKSKTIDFKIERSVW